jgi:nucleotide-binding universal stress UspA family protein
VIAAQRPCALSRAPEISRRLRKPPIAARDVHRSRRMASQHEPTLLGVAPQAIQAAHAARAARPQPVIVRRYRIVVGLDLSEYADIVLEHALDQAARHDAPELHFLTVRERRKPTAEERKRALWERVHPALETFNRHGTDWRAQLHVRRGKPEVEIATLAADIRADLIVIGQFGLHTPRVSDKNLPNRVLQQAVCPTLVISMPLELDTRQCPLCVATREHSEGETWFCPQHTGDRGRDHFVSPMTTWSGGSLM